ncbi:Acetate kinase [Candidatus Westeberhardia cardiocondylae]|uniref:Acetate kinase n=1 Tax=Candidatus Westeberhardia cardiocondylae TaxID=1594731 RepID=A0A0H5BX47_9ENTR|nr:acetate kinase [Candidatus Westeberhardia cardiocondylae]CEN32317.1 Acetate kinase [Candidatus Westeberhardia cardiocondylae]
MFNKLILVLNCGSSSIKFSVIDFSKKEKCLFGLAEFFLSKEVCIEWKIDNVRKNRVLNIMNSDIMNTVDMVLDFIIDDILKKELKNLGKLFAVGHRVVHGGMHFIKSEIISDDVIKNIEDSISFAPLHNPAHLIGIRKVLKKFPYVSKKNVAVFDTAFHQTIKEDSYLYPLPYFLYTDYGVRRYGAHGISHFYVSRKSAEFLNKSVNEINVITCHLGNGSSISAIRKGKCVDTSMGMTPLEGLVMGTRCGDIDPSIIFYLYEELGMSIEDIKKMLYKKSGLLGLSGGISSDCRYMEKHYHNVFSSSHRAINVFCHRLAKYIGSYSILMDGELDAVIFTGGIGENSALIRELTLKKLILLNFKLDYDLNSSTRGGKSGFITSRDSRPAIVIPTNEELIISQDVVRLIG